MRKKAIKKTKKFSKLLKPAITVLLSVLIIFTVVHAGSLTPPASPAATMHSLSDIAGSGFVTATHSLKAVYDKINGLVTDIWNKQTSELTTAGSIGKLLIDNSHSAADVWLSGTRTITGGVLTTPGDYKADVTNLDATVSSRAPASTALSNTTWTDAKAGYLDAAISSISGGLDPVTWTNARAGYLDKLNITNGLLEDDVWTDARGAKLDNLDAAVSGRSSHTAADVATSVWGAGTKVITGGALTTPADYKATGFSTHSAADVWTAGTRTLTDAASYKADVTNLDATVSSRAPASTALLNTTWTDAKAGYLDAAISSISGGLDPVTWTNARAGYLDKLNITNGLLEDDVWTDAKAGYLDAAISSIPTTAERGTDNASTHTAANVWEATTRKLTKPQFACSSDMVYVESSEGGFCIDKYEASAGTGSSCSLSNPGSQANTLANLDEAGCKPVSISGAVPWRYISQGQAALACAKAGKRLPTNKEWFYAALGTPDLASGWGANDCNVNSKGTPGNTGSWSNCVSTAGAYDMVGNVWEWVADSTTDAAAIISNEVSSPDYITGVDGNGLVREVSDTTPNANYNEDQLWYAAGYRGFIRGGFWGDGAGAGVFALYLNNAPSSATHSIGFRCAR